MKFISLIFLIFVIMQVGCVTVSVSERERYAKHLKAQNAILGLDEDMRADDKRQELQDLLEDFTSTQRQDFTYKYGGIYQIQPNRLDNALKEARNTTRINTKRRKGIKL